MENSNQWLDWLKCNVLELIILVLVIVLLVKVYSPPAADEVPLTAEEVAMEEPLAEETAPEVLTEPATVPLEGAPEQPLEATLEPPAEVVPTG